MDLKELTGIAFDRALAQKNLIEAQKSRLTFAHNGAIWYITTEFMALLNLYQNENEIIILDANSIPRKINPTELLNLAKVKHQEVMNDWIIEYSKLSRIRTAKDVK